jgi:2-dehydropantoate 2-reductase
MIAALFRGAGIECRAVAELKRARWEKLVWNIPFNGISALTGRPVDALLATEESRALIEAIMGETIAAANAQSLCTPIEAGYAGEMIRFSLNMGPYKPSMLIDREEGRPLEIEAIIGKPLEYGTACGVPMPGIGMLYRLLQLMAGEIG